jgi:hypothetical protein
MQAVSPFTARLAAASSLMASGSRKAMAAGNRRASE